MRQEAKRGRKLANLMSDEHITELLKKCIKVKSMQRSGTGAIRTQTQPSKPKREITNITNSQNTKRTYGQPSVQLFPKRWPHSNRNRTEYNMNTRKVKRHRNSDSKNWQQRTTAKLQPWSVLTSGVGGLKLVLCAQHHRHFLKWYKTFSWLFGSHRMITL